MEDKKLNENFNLFELKIVPLVSLRDISIFPYMVVPLFIGRNKSVKAIEDSIMNDKILMLATQRQAITEDPTESDIFTVGTISEVLQVVKLPDGTMKVLIEGKVRGKIRNYLQTEPFFVVEVELLSEKYDLSIQIEALMRNVLIKFDKYIKATRTLPPEAYSTVSSVHDPSRFADLIASHLVLKVEEKQSILESFNVADRLEKIDIILEQELEILDVKKKIQSNVRKQMEKAQKEYYLKEQLKAIHKELGEEEERSEEIEEYYKKVREAKLLKEIEEKANSEIKKLAKMPPGSAEAVVVRNYLDWLLSMPWNKKTKETLDLEKVEKILNEDHYGLEKVKERIVEYLAVRKLKGKKKGAILCFVGPPGVGKTSLGKSIARALNRKYVRVSLGGVRDEAEIRGHRRTYIGALPGRIIQTMKKAGTKNPVFLLDEVDKMSTDFRGDPSAALLEVLDPEQNKEFSDHYLEVPFDLSDVMFITTANLTHSIPSPLLDRMEVLELPGYTEIEKKFIADLFLIPRQIEEHGLKNLDIKFSDGALEEIIRTYTREAGVRNLEREIATIFRKIAKENVLNKKKKDKYIITKTGLKLFLGVPKYRYGLIAEKDEIGVATGLAWTPAGGDVLTIEVTLMKGKGKLNLTGQLGEIMQESAQAALSFTRSKATTLGISEDFYQKYDIHIHVPEGSIPKDGPSAGITLATALISALLKKPVNRNVAMTGEITLRGTILPVGGIKEKLLSAQRAGIKTVILPEENKKDFKEIPSIIKKKLDIRFVKTMEEVIEIAIVK